MLMDSIKWNHVNQLFVLIHRLSNLTHSLNGSFYVIRVTNELCFDMIIKWIIFGG